MNWIKLEKETPDKPEIAILARKLGVGHGDAFLAFARLMIWADGATATGFVPFLSPSEGDIFARLPGTCSALASPEIGWLAFSADGMTFVNWDRHNGKSAKHRALEAEKKRKQRSNVPHNVPHQQGTKSGQNGGPEKRREDKNIRPPTPLKGEVALPHGSLFKEAWGRWMAYRSEIKKPLKPKTLEAQIARFAKMTETSAVEMIDQTIFNGWQGLFEPRAGAVSRVQSATAAEKAASVRLN